MCAIQARRSASEPVFGPFWSLWRSRVAPLAPFSALGGLFGLRPWHSCSAFWLSVFNFGVFLAFWLILVVFGGILASI